MRELSAPMRSWTSVNRRGDHERVCASSTKSFETKAIFNERGRELAICAGIPPPNAQGMALDETCKGLSERAVAKEVQRLASWGK